MSLRHAILVLLQDHPGSGYDLVSRFRSGIGHFWNATHQQVYQELKQLSRERLVQHEVHEQDEAPDKKVYQVTRAGRQALGDWYQQVVKPPKLRDALLVKVYGAGPKQAPGLIQELEQHRLLQQKALAEYQSLEAHYFAQDRATRERFRQPYLTLRRGIRYVQGTLEWIDEAIDWLRGGKLPTRPLLPVRPSKG
ncbi:MAG TPA: PadR family transcriptional regulator [Nevskiaceae bacterium]|nr:PadR family transcriptional regulator [Nevskiaceae bacterium]